MKQLLRYVGILFVLIYPVALSAQHHYPTFMPAGDSVVFFRGANAWYLPSKKRYIPNLAAVQVAPEKTFTNGGFQQVSTSKGEYFYVLGRTRTKVLGRGGKRNNEIWLLEYDPSTQGRYKKIRELENIYKLVSEEMKANRKLIITGCATNNRFYMASKESLYSFADDGSDSQQPREELPAIGGLSILEVKILSDGRYALLGLSPSSQPVQLFSQGTQAMTTRFFDLQTKKAVLDVKPEYTTGLILSADNRYLIYRGFDAYHHYDLKAGKQVATYPRSFLKTVPDTDYWYYLNDRYLYIISSLVNNEACYLEVIDLKQNCTTTKYGQLL